MKEYPLSIDPPVAKSPTVADTKQTFFTLFTRPLNSIYRRVLDELLVEVHLLVVHHQFRYDPFFGLGLVTVYERFMDGYRPTTDKEEIFVALTQALGLSAEQLRRDAHDLTTASGPVLLTALEQGNEIESLPVSLQDFARTPGVGKYSRLLALGLATALEEPLKGMPETKRQEVFAAICTRWGLTADRVKKDLDFYSQALEQVRKSKESLDEMMEQTRKKRAAAS
ncbi:photosystem II biogenesis protein Psp29 [Anthocerotibacter panamensis]|uniref:photosystem II biogenesis protein Psp29 n=1 Tax=Anthocerotibacter panamensis TaxID=2857077 RepID=UPI001C408B30|nr:photosystem II biogenesis protein Psp29 [Anthocerotibacter panamensis]